MTESDNETFEYFYDAHTAIECFVGYLSDQWIYTIDGIAALNVGQALAVINLYHTQPKKRLELLTEVKAFAAGVLKHINEQRKKT